jgi:hypothetical protein
VVQIKAIEKHDFLTGGIWRKSAVARPSASSAPHGIELTI